MKPGEKLVDNGVEVALYPEYQLIITQPPHGSYSHQNIEAMDVGGDGQRTYYAPFTMKVVENNDPNEHRVIFHTLAPTKTSKCGTVNLSMMILHDNDVNDLPVGRVIPQGDPCWHSGGYGPNGAYTYPWHSHISVALGHVTEVSNWQLVGGVNPQDVFFVNDTEIIQTMGMNFVTYVQKEQAIMLQNEMLFCPQTDMRIREFPTTDSKVIGLLKSTVEINVTEKSTNLVNGYIWLKVGDGYCALLDENWLYQKVAQPVEIIVEPVGQEPTPIIEPIQEPLPIVELVVEETPNIAPQPLKQVIEPCETVEQPIPMVKQNVEPNLWVKIIAIIIKFILSLLKRK